MSKDKNKRPQYIPPKQTFIGPTVEKTGDQEEANAYLRK